VPVSTASSFQGGDVNLGLNEESFIYWFASTRYIDMVSKVVRHKCDACETEYKSRVKAEKCEALGLPTFDFEGGAYIPEIDRKIVMQLVRLRNGKHCAYYELDTPYSRNWPRKAKDVISQKALHEEIAYKRTCEICHTPYDSFEAARACEAQGKPDLGYVIYPSVKNAYVILDNEGKHIAMYTVRNPRTGKTTEMSEAELSAW